MKTWRASWILHCLRHLRSVASETTSKLIAGYVMPSTCQSVSRFTCTQPLPPVASPLNPDHLQCSRLRSSDPDDELGAHSGCATDYTCENPSCSRAFHSVCLRDWLRSITTTRQYVRMNPPRALVCFAVMSCWIIWSSVLTRPLFFASCWQVLRCPVRELPLLQRSRCRQGRRPLNLVSVYKVRPATLIMIPF